MNLHLFSIKTAQKRDNVCVEADFAGYRNRFFRLFLMIGPATVGLSATLAPALSGHGKPTDVTYLKDVAPILERRCGSCHDAGGSSGVPLDSYERVRTWSREIRADVLDRSMPPWPAAPGFGDFQNDRSLTPIEIELLAAWADGGTPLGASSAGTLSPPVPPAGDAVTITLPAGHPSSGEVEEAKLPLGLKSRQWITGWEYRPGDAAAERHAEFFVDGTPIGAWLPSQETVRYPDGVTVAASTKATLSVARRYRKSEARETPGGRLTLFYGSRAGAARARLQLACGENTIRRAVRAIAITPYAPADGDAVEIVAQYRDGRSEPLSVVPRYRAEYPFTYAFRRPVVLTPGTVVDVRSPAQGCSAALDVIETPPGGAAARAR